MKLKQFVSIIKRQLKTRGLLSSVAERTLDDILNKYNPNMSLPSSVVQRLQSNNLVQNLDALQQGRISIANFMANNGIKGKAGSTVDFYNLVGQYLGNALDNAFAGIVSNPKSLLSSRVKSHAGGGYLRNSGTYTRQIAPGQFSTTYSTGFELPRELIKLAGTSNKVYYDKYQKTLQQAETILGNSQEGQRLKNIIRNARRDGLYSQGNVDYVNTGASLDRFRNLFTGKRYSAGRRIFSPSVLGASTDATLDFVRNANNSEAKIALGNAEETLAQYKKKNSGNLIDRLNVARLEGRLDRTRRDYWNKLGLPDPNQQNTFQEQQRRADEQQGRQSFLRELLGGIRDILGHNPLTDVLKWILLWLGKSHPILAAIGLTLAPLGMFLPRILRLLSFGGRIGSSVAGGVAGLFGNKLNGPVGRTIYNNIGRGGLRGAMANNAYWAWEKGSNINTGVRNAFGAVRNFVTKPNIGARSLQGIARFAGRANIGGALGTVGRFLGPLALLGPVTDVIKDIPDIREAHKNGNMTQQLAKTGGGVAGTIIGGIFGGYPGALLGNWLGRNLGEGLGPGLQSLVDGLQAFGTAIKPITNWFGDLGRKVLKSFGNALESAGFIAGKALHGLAGVFKTIGTFFSNLVKGLGSLIGSLLDKLGKFASVMAAAIEAIKNLPIVKQWIARHNESNTQANYNDTNSRLSDFQRINELKKQGWTDKKIKKESGIDKKVVEQYKDYSRTVLKEYAKKHNLNIYDVDKWGPEHNPNDIIAKRLSGDMEYAASYGAPVIDMKTKVKNGKTLAEMKSLNLAGTVDSGNSVPWIAAQNVGSLKFLDNYLASRGYGITYTSAMGGKHNTSDRGLGHYDGAKVDVQLWKNGKPAYLTSDEMSYLKSLGYWDNGGARTGALGWEPVDGQKGGGHYDFGLSTSMNQATKALTSTQKAVATATATQEETATSVATASNGLRQSVFDRVYGKDSSLAKAREIIFTATDVTGSLGVWGITQVNNTGRMRT